MTKEIRPLRVLIAEDSEDDLIFIMRELRRGGFEMSFRRVDNEKDLAEAISAGVWDLVIADYRMPLLSGLEVVRSVRAAGLDVPVIIVSGYMGEDFAVTAMQAGADDYILKDRLSRLPPAVERELREYETRRARRKAEEEILFLNRLLETILEVDKMVVRESCSGRVFSETCRILVEKAGFMMAWIGKADFAGASIRPVCHAGCAEGFFAALNDGADGKPFGMGLAGAAVRTGRHAVCLDTETDERYAPWREAARAFGFRACASFPILAEGAVFGSMNVYSSSPGSFAGKTIDLLESLAADIGFALQSFEQSFERKKAEAAMRDSEKRLRTIFDSALDGMFVIDLDGNYLDVNLAGCRMFGYTKEELLSSGVRLLVQPEAIGKIEEHRRAWKDGGYMPEVRLRRKDGSEIWVDMAITPLRVGDKELALGIKRDITARKMAEEALRESEERFRQMFEQNQDAQVILGLGGCRVIDANPAAVALFGYTRAELTGMPEACFMGPEVCVKVKEGYSTRGGFSFERTEAVRKDGTKAVVSLRGQVINLRQSAMVLCTVKDLTELLRMEEEARNIQAKLIHANKMASIGTLASGVAHEINNPNNFILFNSTLLSDAWKDAARILETYYRDNGDFSLGGLPYSEMSEVVPELLAGITDGSRRIKGIVDNLKDFSRKDKAGLEGSFDVNRAVKASVSILSNQITKYTDSFEVDCAEDLPKVRGSSQKVEQVIINLVLNALHALPDRKRRVRVSTRQEEGKVVIEVRDEGDGMAREVLDRVMEPFFTTKSDRGGTGLGLSISYSIIKEHRGSLELDSAPGAGTAARITLPAAAADCVE
ncbi:two-component system, sporulation sensor kinase E [uncultured bacterium]|nr:two-component system, sporulation sensor kinase E [uncultured bacterium]